MRAFFIDVAGNGPSELPIRAKKACQDYAPATKNRQKHEARQYQPRDATPPGIAELHPAGQRNRNGKPEDGGAQRDS